MTLSETSIHESSLPLSLIMGRMSDDDALLTPIHAWIRLTKGLLTFIQVSLRVMILVHEAHRGPFALIHAWINESDALLTLIESLLRVKIASLSLIEALLGESKAWLTLIKPWLHVSKAPLDLPFMALGRASRTSTAVRSTGTWHEDENDHVLSSTVTSTFTST